MNLKSYAANTHQGPYLDINEDAYDFDLDNGLFMVLDGFGGSGVGDICVQKLKEYIKTFYIKISSDPDSTMPFYYSQKYLIEGNALINAMLYSHRLISKDNIEKSMDSRGGASAVFAAISENIITFSSVGNCMVLLYRQGALKTVILDDSFRLLGSDDFNEHYRTMPASAFGLFDDLHYGVKEVKILSDDIFILLTDGVFSRLKLNEIEYVMGKQDPNLNKKIDSLFEISNTRGNLDNQTALILKF